MAQEGAVSALLDQVASDTEKKMGEQISTNYRLSERLKIMNEENHGLKERLRGVIIEDRIGL